MCILIGVMRASTLFIGIDEKSALRELFPAFEDEKVGESVCLLKNFSIFAASSRRKRLKTAGKS